MLQASTTQCDVLCRMLLQFERACKEVLQDDHQLTAEGEEQHFEDVQVRWVCVVVPSSKALARFMS